MRLAARLRDHCVRQSYILVTVMRHLQSNAASSSELVLLSASIDGATFADILPRSIASGASGSNP